MGYSGKIVSFEPVSHLYEQLSLNAKSDPLWFTEKLAVGRSACQVEIHVSGGHAGASSVLEMTDKCTDQCSGSAANPERAGTDDHTGCYPRQALSRRQPLFS